MEKIVDVVDYGPVVISNNEDAFFLTLPYDSDVDDEGRSYVMLDRQEINDLIQALTEFEANL